MKRVKKFGVLQTAKVAAVIYFVMTAIIIIPFIGISSLIGGDFFPWPFGSVLFGLAIPVIYGLMIFVTTILSCVVYNLISDWTGGIELELETVEGEYLE